MNAQERESAEAAGMEIGEAWNVLHWAILQRVTGGELAGRAALALERLDKARSILAGMAEAAAEPAVAGGA